MQESKSPQGNPSASGSGREFDERAVAAVVARGPTGTWAVAGVATALVLAIYFAFYVFAFLPRGAVQ
jgi:hypothetical protein